MYPPFDLRSRDTQALKLPPRDDPMLWFGDLLNLDVLLFHAVKQENTRV